MSVTSTVFVCISVLKPIIPHGGAFYKLLQSAMQDQVCVFLRGIIDQIVEGCTLDHIGIQRLLDGKSIDVDLAAVAVFELHTAVIHVVFTGRNQSHFANHSES